MWNFLLVKPTWLTELFNIIKWLSEIDSIRGTGYGVYNAVAGYFQNVKNFHSDEVKMKSIVLGGLVLPQESFWDDNSWLCLT